MAVICYILISKKVSFEMFLFETVGIVNMFTLPYVRAVSSSGTRRKGKINYFAFKSTFLITKFVAKFFSY